MSLRRGGTPPRGVRTSRLTSPRVDHLQHDMQRLDQAVRAGDDRVRDPQRWLRELHQHFTTDEERHGKTRSKSSGDDVTFF